MKTREFVAANVNYYVDSFLLLIIKTFKNY